MPNIKTRIINKHDTEANWALAENFKPLAGEVIVYDIDSNHAYPRFKVGDGKTLVNALPFSTDVLTSYVTETELASALNETTSAINKTITTIDDEVATHVAATNNPHQVTKAQVGLGNVDNVRQYSTSNPPPYPVKSVAGKTGAVTLAKSDVGLSNVDNVKQYSASNPPPYPVTSVNGETGAVSLSASDVGAATSAQGAKADQAATDIANIKDGTTMVGAAETANRIGSIVIQNNADLNDCIANINEVQVYTCQTNGTAATLANCPVDVTFTMWTTRAFKEGSNSSRDFQFLIATNSQCYYRVRSGGTNWANWRTLVESNGSYPTLGAGYLTNGRIISSGSTRIGWYKFMQVSNLYASIGYSAILLVNGVLHTNDGTHSNSEHSGIIEIDYYNTNNSATYYAVNVLAGNLTPEDFCLTASGNSISIYKKFERYQSVQFVELSVAANGATTEYMSELQSSAPSGAVYAVNRNVAAKGITPATDSDSDDVATTEWVNDKIPVLATSTSPGLVYGSTELTSSSSYSTSLGYKATASGSHSIALGYNASASASYSIAIGDGAKASVQDNIAIGKSASASRDPYAIAIGDGATASAQGSIAIGKSASASGDYSTVLGASARIGPRAYSTALGYNASCTADNQITLGDNRVSSLRCAVTTITALSDERTKEDIELADLERCLADVEKLPVKRFKYKDWARPNPLDVHRTGFIAQDMEQVFPKNIITSDLEFPVLDDDGNEIMENAIDENGNILYEEDGRTPKQKRKTQVIKDCKEMSTETLLPTLWGAVQYLSQKVKALSKLIEKNKSFKLLTFD